MSVKTALVTARRSFSALATASSLACSKPIWPPQKTFRWSIISRRPTVRFRKGAPGHRHCSLIYLATRNLWKCPRSRPPWALTIAIIWENGQLARLVSVSGSRIRVVGSAGNAAADVVVLARHICREGTGPERHSREVSCSTFLLDERHRPFSQDAVARCKNRFSRLWPIAAMRSIWSAEGIASGGRWGAMPATSSPVSSTWNCRPYWARPSRRA